ncbi:murein hydrolase activator EnvC family protein [Litorihabitans aurantiacus]|uniref:M23ase beta-sheet core domain-containing protein n=1 Tax=Litorihabitans aurantiacus TaxID=1930061 RepID=A0AA37XEK0_9MICO|nr:M23 family metallopeptidase [Litorihabitans aurantiacus]GMA31798.1 hypothetical protein GCM10025875_17900 [Litorihabitans aurantiacus]
MPQVLRTVATLGALGALATTALLASSGGGAEDSGPSGGRADPVADAVADAVAADRDGATTGAPASASTRPSPTGPAGAAVVYDWPLDPPSVVRPFDEPPQPWLAGHRGADLAGVPGAPVRAAADGVVAFAGSVAGKPVVSVDHADGIRTTYEPVEAVVTRGAAVARGDVIGTLAAGHPDVAGAPGTALHWGRAPDRTPTSTRWRWSRPRSSSGCGSSGDRCDGGGSGLWRGHR